MTFPIRNISNNLAIHQFEAFIIWELLEDVIYNIFL